MGYVVAVSTSPKKGMRKKNIGTSSLVEEHGLEGDAHAGPWHRQVRKRRCVRVGDEVQVEQS